MNRRSPSATTAPTDLVSGGDHEILSALVDGQASADELQALWRTDGAACVDAWDRYQVIGQALRAEAGAAVPADALRVQAIMQRVRLESRPAGLSDTAVAPTVPAHTPVAAPTAEVPTRAPAANDDVFRWKMLAGFACLATAAAVVWNMSGMNPGAGAGVQLAQQPSPQPAAVAVLPSAGTPSAPAQTGSPVLAASEPAPVLVQAEQGVILRDARLEELLAAHRQAGGMSALQMPAGFLRSATFDLPNGER